MSGGVACTKVGASSGEAEGGSATVVLVAVLGVVAAVVIGLLAVIRGAADVQRAQTAADLLAIESARRLVAGSPEVCPNASRVSERFDVTLLECSEQGDRVTVRVEARLPWRDTVSARAVAGFPSDDRG